MPAFSNAACLLKDCQKSVVFEKADASHLISLGNDILFRYILQKPITMHLARVV
jgi:hypothetical protein